MSNAIVSLFALTLFVPRGMLRNKPDSLARAYRNAEGVRVRTVEFREADSNEWEAEHVVLVKDNKGKVVRDEKGIPTEKVERVEIPATTRQAMIREWRQQALGLSS